MLYCELDDLAVLGDAADDDTVKLSCAMTDVHSIKKTIRVISCMFFKYKFLQANIFISLMTLKQIETGLINCNQIDIKQEHPFYFYIQFKPQFIFVKFIHIPSEMQNEPPKEIPAEKQPEPIPPQEPQNNYSLSSGSPSNSDDGQGSSESSGSSAIVQQEEGGQKKLVRYKYCCKICKHPDKSKKACVCVVPLSQRRADLGTGCRNCGCTGCSKEDYVSKGEDPEYHPQQNQQKSDKPRKVESKKEQKKPQKRRERSRSRKGKVNSPSHRRSRRESKSRSRSPEIIDTYSMKFHNFDRSLIGSMIIEEFHVNPTLLGFAIPQRTYSYIFGRPR